MAAEKFSISSETIYTIKSAHGVIECKGYAKLKEHGENLLGAFVDRLHSDHTGNFIRDKMKSHSFILENRTDLETIFALQDAIVSLNPDNVKRDHDCDAYYCNRCGTSSGIEYCGDK